MYAIESAAYLTEEVDIGIGPACKAGRFEGLLHRNVGNTAVHRSVLLELVRSALWICLGCTAGSGGIGRMINSRAWGTARHGARASASFRQRWWIVHRIHPAMNELGARRWIQPLLELCICGSPSLNRGSGVVKQSCEFCYPVADEALFRCNALERILGNQQSFYALRISPPNIGVILGRTRA